MAADDLKLRTWLTLCFFLLDSTVLDLLTGYYGAQRSPQYIRVVLERLHEAGTVCRRGGRIQCLQLSVS